MFFSFDMGYHISNEKHGQTDNDNDKKEKKKDAFEMLQTTCF